MFAIKNVLLLLSLCCVFSVLVVVVAAVSFIVNIVFCALLSAEKEIRTHNAAIKSNNANTQTLNNPCVEE